MEKETRRFAPRAVLASSLRPGQTPLSRSPTGPAVALRRFPLYSSGLFDTQILFHTFEIINTLVYSLCSCGEKRDGVTRTVRSVVIWSTFFSGFQTFRGSLTALSTPIFASKASFFSVFRALHFLLCTSPEFCDFSSPLHRFLLKKYCKTEKKVDQITTDLRVGSIRPGGGGRSRSWRRSQCSSQAPCSPTSATAGPRPRRRPRAQRRRPTTLTKKNSLPPKTNSSVNLDELLTRT